MTHHVEGKCLHVDHCAFVSLYPLRAALWPRRAEKKPARALSPKKDEETVDARYLLVYFLSHNGFCSSRIAAFIHKDVRTVNLILTCFEERKEHRKYFGILLENIKKLLGNKGFLS